MTGGVRVTYGDDMTWLCSGGDPIGIGEWRAVATLVVMVVIIGDDMTHGEDMSSTDDKPGDDQLGGMVMVDMIGGDDMSDCHEWCWQLIGRVDLSNEGNWAGVVMSSGGDRIMMTHDGDDMTSNTMNGSDDVRNDNVMTVFGSKTYQRNT